MNLPLAARHAWSLLEAEDEGLYGFMLWASNRLWYYYWQHYITNTLAIIGLVSIYGFIIRLYRRHRALSLRLERIEKEINKCEK